MAQKEENPKQLSELEWTNLLQELDTHTNYIQETPMQRLKRKFTSEPLIPLGKKVTFSICCDHVTNQSVLLTRNGVNDRLLLIRYEGHDKGQSAAIAVSNAGTSGGTGFYHHLCRCGHVVHDRTEGHHR